MKSGVIALLIAIAGSTIAAELPAEVRQLQRKRDHKISEIENAYLTALVKLQKQYVQKGDTAAASSTGQLIEEIKSARNEKESPYAVIQTASQLIPFKALTPVYPAAGSKLAFHEIPGVFKGAQVELIKNQSTDPINFTVSKSGTVHIITEQEAAESLQVQGWEIVSQASIAIPESLELKRIMPILRKQLDAGSYSITAERSKFGTRLIIPTI